MKFLKYLFCETSPKPMKKHFLGTAYGYDRYEPLVYLNSMTIQSAEYFYNLYEYEDGRRTFERSPGRVYDYDKTPDNADFSMIAQIRAWIHGGDLPKTINTLKNSTKYG
ncbi:hypothetical protein [Bartonella schoenbuchensis]|uniref:Uncharacterized protein n=1 Tax=Bartonella schoenbuchensis m07a TaxID=1094496 RepID=N6VDQ7_9HYPH|nr:hypothetical protein [Bartonella schoenbuchensis]ENN91910.1 hypothetical protein m07a_07990 [Bartonella schoenbuchensis m07a]